MIIDMNKKQEQMTMKIEGRLDTTTSPQLQKALEDNLTGISHLILDFTALEFISSAGLRILLATHNAMGKKNGSMVVIGSNEEVRGVFNITGLLDILNIE